MTAIARRSVRAQIPATYLLAAADDLDGFDAEGLADATHGWVDVTGAQRVIIVSFIGTAGTAGIDVIQIGRAHV